MIEMIIPVMANDDGLTYPLKPSPSIGPYDDQKFLNNSTAILTKLSGKIIPIEGPDLLNLKSEQIQLSRLNISPDFYPEATKINAYLFKISQAGETYGTSKRLTEHPDTLGSPVYDQYTKARSYYSDAMEIWTDIKDLFPNTKPPVLPDPKLPIHRSNENGIPSDSIFGNK
ncbi:hypothetical protein [Methanospirillum lacunae]